METVTTLTPWQVGATLVGSVVGAGFASGQELYQFFAVHGGRGLFAAGLSVSVLVVGLQLFCRRLQADPGPYLAEPVIIALVALSLPIMLAGGGAALQQQISWPPYAGEWLLAATAITILWAGLRGLAAANVFFVPLLSTCFLLAVIATAVGLGDNPVAAGIPAEPAGLKPFWSGLALSPPTLSTLTQAAGGNRLLGGWLWNLWVYACYNGLLVVPVVAALVRGLTAGGDGRLGQGRDPQRRPTSAGPEAVMRRGIWLGGGYLVILAVVGTALLLWPHPPASPGALPLLDRMRVVHPYLGWLYWLALLVEMWNTAVAALYTTADFFTRRWHWPYRLSLLLTAGGALLVSPLGFSSLVGAIYPILGYLALVWLAVFVLAQWRRSRPHRVARR